MFAPVARIKQIIEDDKNYQTDELKLGGIWDVLQRSNFTFEYTMQGKAVEVKTKEPKDEGAEMSWMIDPTDPARIEIARRAQLLNITGTPEKAAHNLGTITLQNGQVVNAHVVHAVDPIITDGAELVVINRKNDPGKGLPALPGGFLDPTKGGGVESAVQAAAREAAEEAGVNLATAPATLIGVRNMHRPFDVRVAANSGLQINYGIAAGDIFMVSTQAVRFDVPDLKNTKLEAGDDAEPGTARRVKASSLTKASMGIPDHYDMIVEVLGEIK